MTLALLVLACALTWAGRAYVQLRAGRPPAPWALVEVAIVALTPWAAWEHSTVLAACAAALGGVVFVVGLHVGAQVDAVVDDARLGRQEREARLMLRRATPPEARRRALTPLSVSPEFEAECQTSEAQAKDALRSLHA